MSKSEAIDALMESALHEFSQHGYEGASLRDIAREADVPLSTIHLYFGSKSELFRAVGRRAWDELDEERSAYLEKALQDGGDNPSLEDLIYALAFPVVRRALSPLERDIAQIYILRRHTSHWQARIEGGMLARADRSMMRWIEAIRRSCPSFSHQDTVWAFSFVIGVVYSWQLIDHRYDQLLGADEDRTPEDVASDVVAFCVSGIRAMARRHSARPQNA